MSEKSSDYHKKTCIICGCHTNQTINIYEPRSGPNIVRLIQARFKFQPLNDDKYLCYSCNNWLINWHSLQALNSNDADSPSGTFRSSQMNNMVSEKEAPPQPNRMSKGLKPIAQVRPQLQNRSEQENIAPSLPKTISPLHSNLTNTTKPSENLYPSKRCFQNSHRMKKSLQKRTTLRLHNYCMCGRAIRRKILTSKSSKAKVTGSKCRRCRDTAHWRNMYLKTLLLQKKQQLPNNTKSPVKENLVNCETLPHNTNCPTSKTSYQPRQYQRPLVDGKVVSMLRRLGTTLSRDSPSSNTYQPPIMSPAKKKSHQWSRNVADNEIVINFNTAITEVLPIRHIRRKLTYQISDNVPTLDSIEINSSDDDDDDDEKEEADVDFDVHKNARQKELLKMNEKINCGINLQQVYNLLPKGLTVSLIADSKSILVN